MISIPLLQKILTLLEVREFMFVPRDRLLGMPPEDYQKIKKEMEWNQQKKLLELTYVSQVEE
jgi:hypothetical protein